MSKGSNSSTTTSGPNPAAMGQYQDLLRRISDVSQRPYQAYGGEQVAPINAQQQMGVANINANAGFANPFVVRGAESITGGMAPITGDDISNYYDPYNQRVIEATMADFDTQNARQQSQVTGNAAAQSALGGNRVGVAQALTAEAQNRTQAPVIAGLHSQGFTNAQNAAMADRSRAITGGSTLAGTGIAGQTAAMQGAGAQIGAGTMEQQTRQAQDTAALMDYFRQQGYDFQTAQWAAQNIVGVGSQMGGTSQTQGPEPNQWAQAAGLGIAGLGMFMKDGGGIPGFAAGGKPDISGPWSGAQGWVPTVGPIQLGKGAPDPPSLPKQDSMDTTAMAKGFGALGKQAKKWWDSPGMSSDTIAPSSDGSKWSGSPYSLYADGGGVHGYAAGSGVPVSAGYGGGEVLDFTDMPPLKIYSSETAEDRAADNNAFHMAARGVGSEPGNNVAASNLSLIDRKPPVATNLPTQPPKITAEQNSQDAEQNSQAGVASRQAATNNSIVDNGVNMFKKYGLGRDASTSRPEESRGGFGLNLSDEARQGLISMGLGMMSNQRGGKGSFLSSVGEGGQQGMATYASARAATAAQALQQRKEAEQTRQFEETLKEKKAVHAETVRQHNMPKIEKSTNEDGLTEFHLVDPIKQTIKKLTAQEVSSATIAGVPIVNKETSDNGLIGANNKLISAGPYDYKKDSPNIEKGMDVPDPQSISNRSAASIKTDAEKYFLTGVLPVQPRGGKSPVAIQQNNYRNAVQNYANALAASRGINPSQLAELHRSAPGMLRFVLGQGGQATVSLGTVIRHLDTITQLAKAWAANDIQTINRMRAAVSKEFGSAAATNLQSASFIIGPEIIKSLGVAGAGTEPERIQAGKIFNTASSPAQILGAAETVQKLLGGQLEGRRRQASAAGVSDAIFKNLIGDRPYEILINADKPNTAPAIKNAVSPMAPAISTPSRPPNVPADSLYSPSRNMWRTPDGKIIPGL